MCIRDRRERDRERETETDRQRQRERERQREMGKLRGTERERGMQTRREWLTHFWERVETRTGYDSHKLHY